MAVSSKFSITLDNGAEIDDLIFPQGGPPRFPEKATLKFLSVVKVDEIPLHLVIGGQHAVTTSDSETERWFNSILLQNQQAHHNTDDPPWWESARLTSPLGVLVAVPNAGSRQDVQYPRITEVVFYAAHESAQVHTPPTPLQSSSGYSDWVRTTQQRLLVFALPLSSDLVRTASELSPPTSPVRRLLDDAQLEGTLLPPYNATPTEIINEPPVRKRKDVNDAFDEASDRYKKARRHGGESVAAAAASSSAVTLPSLKHRRSASATSGQGVPLQTRPLSRSPSITSSRPTTARAASTAVHRSSLSHMQTVAGTTEDTTCDSKNKDLISRIVMAGMRLYGLSQSKSRKGRASSVAASPAMEASFDDQDDAKRKDEEYKLVYYQVFKGVCFRFRLHMTSAALQSHTDALRDTVDQLLALFCRDPLEAGLPGTSDEFTPGGRKAFGVEAPLNNSEAWKSNG